MSHKNMNAGSFQFDAIGEFARSYHVLDNRKTLESRLSYVIYNTQLLSTCSKPELHSIASEVICNHHPGEAALKAKLTERFVKQDVTAAFEMPVSTSRADFVTINGDSKSFEIKSAIDNLDKLAKQVRDYSKVFDYNYIVVDSSHEEEARDMVPVHYGIIVLEDGELVEKRPASHNQAHDPVFQLKQLTKKEFQNLFNRKDITIEEVLINFEAEEINNIFKSALKRRYCRKWSFIREHAYEIMPSDYQFFFHHNLAPSIIYDSH